MSTSFAARADDVEQARALARSRRRATGLLAVVAVAFLGSFALPDATTTGYLRAALEAVGASTEGNKPTLVERLVKAQQASSGDAMDEDDDAAPEPAKEAAEAEEPQQVTPEETPAEAPAAAIRRLDHDHPLAARLGEAARAYAAANCGEAQTVSFFAGLLNQWFGEK